MNRVFGRTAVCSAAWLVGCGVLGCGLIGCGGDGGGADSGSTMAATDGGSVTMEGSISATANGEAFAVPAARAVTLGPAPEHINLAGTSFADGVRVNVQLDIPGTSPGSFPCTADAQYPRIQFQRLDGARNLTADTILGGSCQIDVTEVGPVGGMIRGTFSAHTENGSGVVDIVGGMFAVTRQG